MMQFRTIKANLETILNDAAASRFQVVGHQQQGSSAEQFLDSDRSIQVYTGSGNFPKGKADLTGPVQHEVTYKVELTVSAAAKVNLAVINDIGSTPAQRSAEITSFQTGSAAADESYDELVDIVYQILMDGRNVDIGTTGPPFTVSDRWVSGWNKGTPLPDGEYVMLTGSMDYTCQMIEEITGDTGPTVISPIYDIDNEINEDPTQQTGSLVGG